jgi:hypothetical protein
LRDDLIKAKELLSRGHACAACKNDTVYTADGRGIAPLMSIIEKAGSLGGFTVCDKVIGSAAAYLMIEAGVSEAYAKTASKRAVKLFASHNVVFSYSELTDFIKNRAGDGLCPMEKTALQMTAADGAYGIFKAKLKELKNENNSGN